MKLGDILVNGKVVNLYDFKYQKSQLFHEIRNVQCLNGLEGTTSGARKQMFKSHISQRLVINNCSPKRIVTGAEFEYAKAIFNTTFEHESDIIKIIPYYQPTVGSEIGPNPETLVVFEYFDQEENKRVVDCLTLNEYSSFHSYFGYKNKKTKHYNKIAVNSSIDAGTTVLTSPSVDENGMMMYGIEREVALMTHPCASEDGVGMSVSCANELGFIKVEKRVVEWGSSCHLVNLYGDDKNFRGFPKIGERIHKSGRLVAFKKYDEDNSVVDMSVRKAKDVDTVFGNAVYVDGEDGVVVDIRVLHDPNQTMATPDLMAQQPLAFDASRRVYYSEIVKLWKTLVYKYGDNLVLSPKLNNTIQYALSVYYETQNMEHGVKIQHPQKFYRGSPIDDFRVEFTIVYKVKPTVGFKVTGIQGDKGVVVAIIPDDHMPVSANGVRADIVMDPNATIARMNMSRIYEQAFNAASRDLVFEFLRTLGVQGKKLDLASKMMVEQRWRAGDPTLSACWDRLMDYYGIFSSYQRDGMNNLPPEKKLTHFINILTNGIYLYIPGFQDEEPVDMLRQVKERFLPERGKVTYKDFNGVTRVTKNNILIGSMYIMVLEKIGDDWTAVSSGKFQNFGVLAKLTNKDKYSQPTRNQAIRAGGEAEMRIIMAYCGPFFAAEFLDRNSNMQSHREACECIVSSKYPTNIPVLIDRNTNPLGKPRPIQLIKHLAYCNGWKYVYKPYVERDPVPGSDMSIDYEAMV